MVIKNGRTARVRFNKINNAVNSAPAASEEAAAAEGTDQKWETETGEWTAEEAAHMRAYSCPSCGASLIADENTAVTVCPYCSNPTVVAGQFVTKKPQFLLAKATITIRKQSITMNTLPVHSLQFL